MKTNNIPQADDPASAPLHREPISRQRILVVEDDDTIRRFNTEALTDSGYLVDAAEDGAAAWDALQLKDYDLMVTDNNMPKVTGVELILKLKVAGLNLPVIMATGTLHEDNFDPYRSLQPAMTLLKPYTSDELLAAVKEVLRTADDSIGEIAPSPNWRVQPLADRLRL